LTSVAVTPGISAATADVAKAKLSAHTAANVLSICLLRYVDHGPLLEARRFLFAHGRCPCRSQTYSSIFELVKQTAERKRGLVETSS
jgi:hypothetical protein